MKSLGEVSRYNRTAAWVFGGISICLLFIGISMASKEYRDSTLPRVVGRIEQTWIVNRRSSSRFADLSFAVTNEGKQIGCYAKNVYIAPGNVFAEAGDDVELMTTPGSCERPWVPIDARVFIIIFLVGGLISGTMMLQALKDDRSRLARATASLGWLLRHHRQRGAQLSSLRGMRTIFPLSADKQSPIPHAPRR